MHRPHAVFGARTSRRIPEPSPRSTSALAPTTITCRRVGRRYATGVGLEVARGGDDQKSRVVQDRRGPIDLRDDAAGVDGERPVGDRRLARMLCVIFDRPPRGGEDRGHRSAEMVAVDDFDINDLCIRCDTERRAGRRTRDRGPVRVAEAWRAGKCVEAHAHSAGQLAVLFADTAVEDIDRDASTGARAAERAVEPRLALPIAVERKRRRPNQCGTAPDQSAVSRGVLEPGARAASPERASTRSIR